MSDITASVRPKSPRIRPFDAALALYRLLRDPQDTRQVFRLTDALRGKSGVAPYQRFRASPVGARAIAEQRHLLTALSDHAALSRLPEGSVGREYLAFMQEQGLSAEGLVTISGDALDSLNNREDGAKLFARRLRDMHDLCHIITGYGRDELGEVCVLAFSYPQQKIRSFAVIAALGALRTTQMLRRAGLPREGVIAAVREAYRHGKSAAWLPGEDLEALLTEDLIEARRRLGIAPPTRYDALMRRIRAAAGRDVSTLSELVTTQH
ncbi:ubiquinone biosynthesis protein COQ4 [Acidiphilium sp. AL]|uniref:ubiquinone biosynthesis protein COQ4 n=1 Tax=Acidiphilium sp. AL TaxID=2871704 RepID=UPI0021CB2F0B|nr:ubiquinone biosynthesis protein COQ4 [Acidiphilium sp. AL]MCU4159914.1 ubiquinone biosynthesis protein COQ4 [Acidiphilium sp. AL]